MNYEEYIKSDEWKRTRLWALDRADNKCQICSNKTSLQVHHNEYARIGKELPSDLIVLCDKCHKLFHESLPAKVIEIEKSDEDPDLPLKRILQQIKIAEKHSIDEATKLSLVWNGSFSAETIMSWNEKYLRDLRVKALQTKIEMKIEYHRELQDAKSGDDLIETMRIIQSLIKQKIEYSKLSNKDLIVEFVKEFPDINNYLSNLF